MKVGILGGTFDPIHLGHHALAVQLKEARGLDEVWLCPANVNPFKENEGTISVEHRLEMARRAVKNCPFIQVMDHEAKRPPPSFTIDTLNFLKKEYPNDQFALLLGEDAMISFESWKASEEIARNFPLYTGTRLTDKMPFFKNKIIEKAVAAGWTPLPRFDISATQVRERLKRGAYCGHLLHQEVLDYISDFNLY